MQHPGNDDLRAAAQSLAGRLPVALQPLAAVAYDYRWSWAPDGPATFAAIDQERWTRTGHNPVRLLVESAPHRLRAAAEDGPLVERVRALAAAVAAERERPGGPWSLADDGPVAFLCAEFAVHESLPIYSGGLGVLAGDILKEASDLAVPMVAVGLLYRYGYFQQRLDVTGRQHESWVAVDADLLPMARVRDLSGEPLVVTVPTGLGELSVAVWRVDVGRVPLYLLDTDLPANDVVGRWVTARLYEGDPSIRLAQYAVLGVGAVRALDRMGITPSTFHVNEGHPILATAQLLADRGDGFDGLRDVRGRVVFTTHTPVPAGNERYPADQAAAVLGPVAALTGDADRYLGQGRIDPEDAGGEVGMTPLALRLSRSVNAVSERHGEVVRSMWRPVFADAATDADVPITHVTNGVHLPTWVGDAMAGCFDRHLGERWRSATDDPAVWAAVDDIPDAELWAARNQAREALVVEARRRSGTDRLRRGEPLDYVEAGMHGFDPGRLTVGFARRIATYKRLHLLTADPDRALRLLGAADGLQLLLAGKAHPRDEAAKEVLRTAFLTKGATHVADRVAFIEDYDLSLARALVAGCDVWLNLPRPPQEASGTSGMKAAANGCLNLSVLDGWWAEAFDGANGWAIDGETAEDEEEQDRRHATEVFDRLEQQVLPLFHDRDADGVPRAWVAMVRANLRTNAPRFSATRMVRDYATRIYPAP